MILGFSLFIGIAFIFLVFFLLRSVFLVRQAEVSLMDLALTGQEVRPELLQFFNRLSDLLFVMARLANQDNQVADILWSGQLD